MLIFLSKNLSAAYGPPVEWLLNHGRFIYGQEPSTITISIVMCTKSGRRCGKIRTKHGLYYAEEITMLLS